jgi:hypothetical protein
VLGGVGALDAQLHEVATDAGVTFPAPETP